MPVQPFDKTQGKPASGASPANVSAQKAPPPSGSGGRPFIKIPTEALFSGIGQILFLASIVVVVGISIIFLGIPSLQKGISTGSQSHKVGPLVPPINVAYINFPSDFQRDIFLKNFQDAGKTQDYQERYKLLANDYVRLLGFYTGDHDPKTRQVLGQYAQYMVNNYQDHAQDSIYTVPCLDSSCGKANYPDAVRSLKEKVDSSSLDKSLKQYLDKNFEAAALSNSKTVQFSYYEQIFQSLKASFIKTKDGSLKDLAVQLRDYMKANYSDLYNAYLKNKQDLFEV